MLTTIDDCLLCQVADSRQDRAAAQALALTAPSSARNCCGLRWLNPQPSDADYRAIYQSSYFGAGRGTSAGDRPLHWLARQFPGKEADYETGAGAARVLSYRQRLRRLPASRAGCRVLDIGAATGDFLAIAQSEGWEVEGLEASAYGCQRARDKYGIELFNSSLEDFNPVHGYDLIHMSHVLEHFTRPDQALTKVRDMLLPSGILVVEVPNQFDAWVNRLRRLSALLRRGRKAARPSVHSIHHTYFFRVDHVGRLLYQKGFQVVSQRTFFPERLSRRLVDVGCCGRSITLQLACQSRREYRSHRNGGVLMNTAAMLRAPLLFLNLRLRSRTWHHYHALAAQSRLTLDQTRRLQTQRLERLLRHCRGQVPYYRKSIDLALARGNTFDDPEALLKTLRS